MRRLFFNAVRPKGLQLRCCVAKATILGWGGDGNVDARLQKVQASESEELREVLQKVIKFENATPHAPNSPPPPLRSLPCLSHSSVIRLLEELKVGMRIPLIDAMQVLSAGSLLFQREPTVQDISGNVIVVGDLHGSLGDLLHILETHGLPGEPYSYVFNGDLVDRGNNGCEILLLIIILKLSTPDAVYINRGNHEDSRLNVRYGFYAECIAKYNCQFFDYACSIFTWLPLATVINKHQAFVVHGGLFKGTINDLRKIPRGPDQDEKLSERQRNIVTDLLWADPAEGSQSTVDSPRGAGWLFGSEYSIPWLENSGIKYLVRSHQCKSRDGLAINHQGRVFTVFSASNYYGTQWKDVETRAYSNDGSVLIFEEPEQGNASAKPGSQDPDLPRQYTWPAVLLEADNPRNSVIQHHTGKPYQYSVPEGRLHWFDTDEFESDKVIDAIQQRRSSLESHIRLYDPDDIGILSSEDFMSMILDMTHLFYSASDHPVNAAFFVDGEESINYKKFFKYHLSSPPSLSTGKLGTWHSEILLSYMELNQRSLNPLDMKKILRDMYPKEFLDNAQIDAVIDHYSTHEGDHLLISKKNKKPDIIKLEWAEDRRRERLARIRQRLTSLNISEQKMRETVEKSALCDNWITKAGLPQSMKDINFRVAPCFCDDVAEEVGKRRDSLDEPGDIGWLPVNKIISILFTDSTPEHKTSAALGLSRAFLTVLYKHRHDLADKHDSGIAVDTFKHALVALNKLNSFPLTHNQITSLITLIDKDGDGIIDYAELSTAMSEINT